VLTGIFGPKMEEITVRLRKLQSEEIHNLCFSSNIIKGKVIPLHAMEALGVRGGIAPTHS
jgi:hypothetical protein